MVAGDSAYPGKIVRCFFYGSSSKWCFLSLGGGGGQW